MTENLNSDAAEPILADCTRSTAPGEELQPEIMRFNHATVRGVLDPATLQRSFTLAIGPNRQAKSWSNVTSTGKEVLDLLTTFEVGPKDGMAVLQGSVAKDGGERNKANQRTNVLVMLDDDTGAPISETVAEIERQSLRAIVYTTHSHGKPETEVNRDQLITWMRTLARNGEPTAKDAGDFLHAKKNTRLEVFADAVLDAPQHGEKGMYQLLRHKPMARKRIVLLLEKPFIFAQRGGLHKEAMVEWAERYAGAAQQIGVAYDHACIDPCRLLYTPRVPPDAKIGDGPFDHQIVVIWGDKSLDLDAVERVSTKRKPEQAQRSSSSARGDSSDSRFPDIQDCLAFMSIVGGDWDAPQWWADTEPDPESWCPWNGIHTRETGKQDTGFKIWGPDENENGWNCQCSHGCGKDPERGAREDGKQDRAKFLYTKALDAGVTDADELVPYITNPEVEAKWRAYREKGKEKAEKRATWDEAETLGKNENRMLVLVGRLNKQRDGAKYLEKYAELKVVTEVIQKRKGKTVKVVRKVPAPPHVVTLTTKRKLGDSALARLNGLCGALRARLAQQDSYMVRGEPGLARRVLVEIKRQRCRNAVSRIMRAQATRDPMTDAAMLTALKGALGDGFNKAQMNGVLSNLRSEYKRKDVGTGAPPQTVDDNGRPIIYIGDTGFERSCSLVWNAVRDENASTPYYFRNADVLSRLKRTEDGEMVAQALEVKDVRYELNRLCAWFRIKPYIGLPISTSADNDVVQEVFATPRIDVPVLKAITRVPTFAPNGRLVMADGFDKESGIYYHPTPGFTPLPVSLRPTADDVQRARDLIFCELLRDFPLTDDYLGTDTLPIYLEQKDADGWPLPNLQRGQAARANALAMILHPHLATIIDDTTPMYMVDATLPASGKGFLTNCVTFISEGRVSAKRPAMKDTYQMRVAITAALLARRSTFLLDNINHHLDDEILANALTAGVWEDRILGGSKDVSIPLRLQFMITMNQGTMAPELLRRTCPIRLDPQVADADLDRPPESFKHWPFQPWALENRAVCFGLSKR